MESAGDVGGNEIAGPGDGTIYMGLCREVHDMGDGMPLNHLQGRRLVAQIHLLENVFGMPGNGFQIRQVTCVGQAIQINQLRHAWIGDDVLDEIRADETRTTGDK
jgi:hypothetical protein